jgi:hypothetical protein
MMLDRMGDDDVRPALLLNGTPADAYIDRYGPPPNTWLARQPLGTFHSKAVSETGRVPSATGSNHFDREAGAQTGRAESV